MFFSFLTLTPVFFHPAVTGASNSPSESNGSIGPAPPPVPLTTASLGTTIVMGPTNVKRKKLTVGDVFNQDDDEHAEGKKRKLIPLDYDDDKGSGADEKRPTTAEEKRQRIKGLIESIPTAKDELFNYPLDWSIVDQVWRKFGMSLSCQFTSRVKKRRKKMRKETFTVGFVMK